MPRVIAIGEGGRARPPERDDRYRAVIELVIRQGLWNQFLLSPVCQTETQATDVKNGLYRSARYYCSCGEKFCTRKYNNHSDGGCPEGGQRVSMQAKPVIDDEGKRRVEFRVMDKREAMRAVVERYGPDPANWPYFAKSKRLKES